MLEVRDLQAFYGQSQVLEGVNFHIQPGEIVALLGRNGAGRSTTARAIMGLVRWRGQIFWRGQSLAGQKTFEVARLGLGYVAESRDIFPGLSVQQNLLLGQTPDAARRPSARRWALKDMYRMFSPLQQRQHAPAGVLSGGEQQMLALCRTLMGNPELVLLDEPTEGLGPKVVQQVASCLRQMKDCGIAVLLIEQKLALAMAVSDRALVLGQGRIVFDGTSAALRADSRMRSEWLAI